MKIITVKQYNKEAEERWKKAVARWKADNSKSRGPMPFIHMFIYDQNYGYVLVHSHGSRWARTRKELEALARSMAKERKLTSEFKHRER
jgi:hypothetical protein